MRKLFLAVALVLGIAAAAQAAFPNLEASVLYDFNSGAVIGGASSKLFTVKDVDVRLGGTNNGAMLAAITYDLKNLEKLGIGVKYAWGETNLTVGGWAGYNFDKREYSYGLMSVMIQLSFGGGQ